MVDLPAVGMKDVVALMDTGKVSPLPDSNEIEAALELIKKYEEVVGDLKDYKKKKVRQIDEAIEQAYSRGDFLRSVIAETLKFSNKTSVRFPGLGKANLRTKRGKWVIQDEQSLLDTLRKEGEYKNCVDESPVIKKKEVNALLDVWERINKLPKCVIREDDTDAVTITFEEAEPDASIKVVKKQATAAAVDEDTLKSLNFTK